MTRPAEALQAQVGTAAGAADFKAASLRSVSRYRSTRTIDSTADGTSSYGVAFRSSSRAAQRGKKMSR
jgi:hypothetical protein